MDQTIVTVPNFVEIAETAAEIWRFSILNMAAAAILNFENFKFFNDRNGQEGRTASLCQILSKSPKPWRK